MDYVIDFVKKLDVSHLLAMAIMLWFFYKKIDDKISALEDRINELEKKVDFGFKSIDRRLSRLEGAFFGKDLYKVIGNDED